MERLIDSLLFFWTSVLYGFWIQSAYQCVLGMRIIIPRIRLLYWLEDLIFWNIAALFTYQMFYKMNFGQIRAYAIMGLLIGMLISFFTVGALLKAVSGKIRHTYLKVKRKINRRRQKKKEKRENEKAKRAAERRERKKEEAEKKQVKVEKKEAKKIKERS